MMTAPLLSQRRPWRLISGLLALVLLIGAWLYRESWAPLLLDAGHPILSRLSSWHNPIQLSLAEDPDSLQAQMTALEAENQLYQKKQAALETIAQENQELRGLLKIEMPKAYQKITAQVILRPPHQWFESLIIDRGFESGLSVNQVVLNAEGVVGKLIEVSAKTAKVQLTSHPEAMVSCLVGVEHVPGVLSGQYRNQPAQLRYLQNHAQIKAGTEVKTSGLGGVYPPGLLLGRVLSVKIDPALPVPEVSVNLTPLEKNIDFLVVLVPES